MERTREQTYLVLFRSTSRQNEWNIFVLTSNENDRELLIKLPIVIFVSNILTTLFSLEQNSLSHDLAHWNALHCVQQKDFTSIY